MNKVKGMTITIIIDILIFIIFYYILFFNDGGLFDFSGWMETILIFVAFLIGILFNSFMLNKMGVKKIKLK